LGAQNISRRIGLVLGGWCLFFNFMAAADRPIGVGFRGDRDNFGVLE
jgi:hypothetical protein